MNVLIFSQQSDISTNNVTFWLAILGHHAVRINVEDTVEHVAVAFDDKGVKISLEVRGKKINLNRIDAVWFRRGRLVLNRKINFPKELDQTTYLAISNHLFKEELVTLERFIDECLYDKPHFGDNRGVCYNKLIALKKAKEVGLKIPTSEINTKKKDLINFFNLHRQDCISKGIQDILSFGIKNYGYNYGTSKIEIEDLEEMDKSFFPSLLQQNIAKKYELRIFYLRSKFYAMAIFSQNDEQTKIDFRNYNDEKPNRNVPYILPKEIEQKLELFMQSMQLDCGSIDMIVTTNNEYVFLEVNPQGQYGMVSRPCGYQLDYEIAKELVNG
mgnify:CR=1 FL=1